LTCSDGTPYGYCNSNHNYCNNGILSFNCNICGCDAGLACIDNACVVGGQALPVCENIDVNGDKVYNILDVIVLNDVNAYFTYVVNGSANCTQPYLVIP
jgi:hypothetical protein